MTENGSPLFNPYNRLLLTKEEQSPILRNYKESTNTDLLIQLGKIAVTL